MCVRIMLAGGGNGTFLTAGSPGFAVFPTEQYSAVAEVIGFLRRKQLAQLIFHLCRIFSGGEPQQVGNADAVGVAYDGGLVVDVAYNQVGSFSGLHPAAWSALPQCQAERRHTGPAASGTWR